MSAWSEVEDVPRADACILHPQLASSGLPTDLYQSTMRRFLWDYFVKRASQVFLCWEPGNAQLDRNYRDPYAEGLPALAAQSQSMRSATLALSAFHYSGGSRVNKSMISSLMMEASQALAASRWVEPQSEKQLLATIGTAALLYLLDPETYSDMLPLSRSAALCLMATERSMIANDVSYQVVMQIFRWADICAQCSLMKHVPVPDEMTQQRLNLRADERATQLSDYYTGWFVHPLYAFSEELISPLRRIAWLIRVRQQGLIFEDSGMNHTGLSDVSSQDSRKKSFMIPNSHFEQLVKSAEEEINKFNMPSHPDALLDGQDDTPPLKTGLSHIASAVHSAIKILLLTRLLDKPWTTDEIRWHVANITLHLCDVKPESKFSNGVVFPLYIAGVEAVDQAHRTLIVQRLQFLPGIWQQQEVRLTDSLKHIWSIRDQDPGAVWKEWVHRGKRVISVPYRCGSPFATLLFCSQDLSHKLF